MSAKYRYAVVYLRKAPDLLQFHVAHMRYTLHALSFREINWQQRRWALASAVGHAKSALACMGHTSATSQALATVIQPSVEVVYDTSREMLKSPRVLRTNMSLRNMQIVLQPHAIL